MTRERANAEHTLSCMAQSLVIVNHRVPRVSGLLRIIPNRNDRLKSRCADAHFTLSERRFCFGTGANG